MNVPVAAAFIFSILLSLGSIPYAQSQSSLLPSLNLRGFQEPAAPLSNKLTSDFAKSVDALLPGADPSKSSSKFTKNNGTKFLDETLYPVAQENFKKWNDALKSKDYEKVASMYSTTDLSFLPTVSDEFVRDQQTTKAYFADFLKKQPLGTITADKVQAFSDDAYLHSGMYTFLTGPDDARKPVDARFSFMWRKIDGVWKIVHHHSSALPRGGGGDDQIGNDEEMYPIAQENFKRWNDALKTKDYQNVASLYSSSDLSFLPTVSSDFIQSTPATEAYFIKFLEALPVGTITADKVQAFTDDAYLHTGMYTFLVTDDKTNERKAVQARFSYAWRKINGVWKIVHHHSSKLPL